MSDLEHRVRGAFDAIEVPAEVKARTLGALDELARQESGHRLGEHEAGEEPRALLNSLKPASGAVGPSKPARVSTGAGMPVVAQVLGAAGGRSSDDESETDGAEPLAPGCVLPFPESKASDSPGRVFEVQKSSGSSSTSHASARRAPHGARWRHAAVALAACFALAVVGIVGAKLYFEETAYVGIDVNPSVELGINRFDIVVSATAFNEDGEGLLQEVPVSGKRYNDAVDALASSAAFEPYLQADAFVEISVTAADARQTDDLQQQSNACLSSLPCEGESQTVDVATREAAMAAGMGTGRYRAALQLIELDPSLSLEDCAAMSMRELRDRIAIAGGGASLAPGGETGSGGRGQEAGKGQGAGDGKGSGGRGPGGGRGPSGQGPGQGNAQGAGLEGNGQSKGR
ncbi:MAG: hypothetical protein RR934_04080 [Gordonibacter sp.]|uniref:anti-sigma-I factor RsgI family protein n=1 Tax=Gordonibacter sp. TaxID=1968902 RepID=UPI0032200206